MNDERISSSLIVSNMLTTLLRRLTPPRRIAPRELGRMGERRAAWFYRWRGWSVVATNVRSKVGEVDLVVRRGNVAAFVEVKTRQAKTAGEPWEAVDEGRETRLTLVAESVARRLGLTEANLRIDVLSLYWDGWGFEIRHFPDAAQSGPSQRNSFL